jgi:hypothetical protein
MEPVRYEDGALGEVRRRWRLGATWALDDGSSGGDGIEVADAETGLWYLRAQDGEDLLAWPVTPTFVWRQIIRLPMRRTEI